MRYVIENLYDVSSLRNFKCGVSAMDAFIQDGLNLSIENHYCRAFSVKEENSDRILLYLL